ncbi:MAG: DUF2244 domain-containing protein [Xanthobacteraceae bacterium]
MTLGNEQADEPTLFSAILTPHRSLTASGFLIVMIAIGGLSFAAGVTFLLLGAWPVFGFFGLDVLLVYLAFRINYRTATAFEEVSVTTSELKVRKVTHRGQITEWTLNPVWVRLDRETHEEFGLQQLFLVSRGRRLPIATFLSPGEKASFATALAAAINTAKRGPTHNEI